MNRTPITSYIILTSLILSTQFGCTPKKKTTSCTSSLYGYKIHALPATPSPYCYLDSNATVTNINPATVTGPGMGSFIAQPYQVQAAFNNTDNCYYAFKTRQGSGAGYGTLYKISTTGTVTTLTGPTTAAWAPTYNKVNHKLYCISGTQLAEIVTSGSTYSLSPVVSPVHPFFTAFAGDNTTVDNNTGAIYFTTGDTSVTYIEKYVPGASSTTVAATISGARLLLGVRYNSSDNMLYAIKYLHPYTGTGFPYDFIKINPSTGVETMITHLGFDVNIEFYSACVDPCTSRYLISTIPPNYSTMAADSFLFNQLDLSGTLVQHDYTTGMYLGLYVNY